MSKRHMIKSKGILIKRTYLLPLSLTAWLTWGNSMVQKPDLNGVEIVTHRVRDNIYMLEATKDVAGNMAVSIGADGILLVDSQFSELADSVLTALFRFHDAPIKYIINTHYHDDHSDGNTALGKDATIIGSHNTRKRLSGRPESGKPTITFTGEMSIHFNGEEIKLISFPNGHTDTDIVVFFTKSNVVHMGDLFNAGITSFPNVDLGAGGTIMGAIEVLGKVIKMVPNDVKIIPGHYEISNREGLERCHRMLRETVAFVKEKKAAGWSLKQIQKHGFPKVYEPWGKTGYTNTNAWIENIFKGIIERGE